MPQVNTQPRALNGGLPDAQPGWVEVWHDIIRSGRPRVNFAVYEPSLHESEIISTLTVQDAYRLARLIHDAAYATGERERMVQERERERERRLRLTMVAPVRHEASFDEPESIPAPRPLPAAPSPDDYHLALESALNPDGTRAFWYAPPDVLTSEDF